MKQSCFLRPRNNYRNPTLADWEEVVRLPWKERKQSKYKISDQILICDLLDQATFGYQIKHPQTHNRFFAKHKTPFRVVGKTLMVLKKKQTA